MIALRWKAFEGSLLRIREGGNVPFKNSGPPVYTAGKTLKNSGPGFEGSPTRGTRVQQYKEGKTEGA